MADLGLDRTDLRLIRLLQEDGRRSFASLGREVGLSEPGVRKRVRRLLERRIIRIVAVSNPLELGFVTAELLVTVQGRSVRAVAAELESVPEVDYLAFCAGTADLIVGLVCRDRDHLLETLDREVKGRVGVAAVQVNVVLGITKEAYDWWAGAQAGDAGTER